MQNERNGKLFERKPARPNGNITKKRSREALQMRGVAREQRAQAGPPGCAKKVACRQKICFAGRKPLANRGLGCSSGSRDRNRIQQALCLEKARSGHFAVEDQEGLSVR